MQHTDSDGAIKFAITFWDSMEAEYPGQWSRAMGENPVTQKNQLTAKAFKWCEVAQMATDSDNVLTREILSAAIKNTRRRKDKQFLPSLGTFEDLVLDARRLYRQKEQETKHYAERKNQKLLGDVQPMTEQQEKDAVKYLEANRVMLSYLVQRNVTSRADRRCTLKNYLELDPKRVRWHSYIRQIKNNEAKED